MKILCDLTPVLTEKVTKGRYTGQDAKYKYVVGGDNWCWNISRVNIKADGSEYPAQGQSYFKGFSHLLGNLKNFGVDPKAVVPTIISALEKNTNTKFDKQAEVNTLDFNDPKGLEKIGDLIDNAFQCNYLRLGHNEIYFRVLKATHKDDGDTEE